MRHYERIAKQIAYRVKNLIEKELPGQVEIESDREWNDNGDEQWLIAQFILIFHPAGRLGNRFASVYYNSSSEEICFSVYSCGYPGRRPDQMSAKQMREIGLRAIFSREYSAGSVSDKDIRIFADAILKDPGAHADSKVILLSPKEKVVPENAVYCRMCNRIIAVYAQNCPYCGDNRMDIEYVATHYRNLRRQQE